MRSKQDLEKLIEESVAQLHELAQKEYLNSIFKPAARGVLKAIAVCAQKTEPYDPGL